MSQVNNVLIEGGKRVFNALDPLIDSTISFTQGDLLVMNTSTHLVGPKPSGETGANVIGVAAVTVVSGQLSSPLNSFTQNAAAINGSGIPGADFGGLYNMQAESGLTLNPGDAIYPGTSGTQRVTNVAGSQKIIGVYEGPAIASTTAGQLIPCKVGSRYPGDTLKF